MLVDAVEIELKSGKGGDGIVSWRREKYVAKGGPDGGDGGNGGSVYLVATHNADTLSSFRYRKLFSAEAGHNGTSKKRTGSSGEDLVLSVPVGTVVTDLHSNQKIIDLSTDGQKVMIAKGGKGGLGNTHFVHATNQNPFQTTQGGPSESVSARLELRLVADIALIGKPNAGKSSIIKALTGIESRIGVFPFSTTQPVLGVLKLASGNLTLIDLPGLIEGAHKGRGLGDEFLKHTRRVKALVHVVDPTQGDPEASIAEISAELEKYDPEVASKPQLIVINKIDLLSAREQSKLEKELPGAVFISASENKNIKALRTCLEELSDS